jgi:erythronate-4-phosphate dehydrogenase
LPLKGWYPKQVQPAKRAPIGWEEMCSTIEKYCPLIKQSEELKSHPEEFESLRNNYSYREEYF